MRISIVIAALTGEFETDIDRAMKRTQRRLQQTGRQMQSIGRQMTLGLTTPIVGFGTLTLRAAGDFEQAMNRVGALSGATGDELQSLEDIAKAMGIQTKFSASEAADALGFLAMAGLNVQQQLGALPGTLQLAAAASMDLGETADIVTNVLSGYGLEVAELGRVNDVLVKTFTSTNTNLMELGEAMSFAAPLASTLGLQFEEVAAAIGLLGNAGIKGGRAGTGLATGLTRLINATGPGKEALERLNVTILDASGNILPLTDILKQLEREFGGLSSVVKDGTGAILEEDEAIQALIGSGEKGQALMQIFGQRSGPAMAALLGQGTDALTAMIAELEASGGTAERISQQQMQGLNGSMLELKSAFEGLQLAIADSGLLEFITDLVKGITAWTRQMAETNPETLKLITQIAAITAVVGPAVFILGSLVKAFGVLLPVLKLAQVAILALAAAGGPFTLLIAAVGAVVAIWANWDSIGPLVGRMVTAVTGWLKDKLVGVLDFVGQKVQAVTGFFRDMYEKVVGNSYVPDMVDGIDREFARLPAVMVQPAERAAEETTAAFAGIGQVELPVKKIEGGFLQIEEFGIQAARNIQTHFADFLFDPFQDGLSGMVKGFADAMRRMLAEAAAAQILKQMFGTLSTSANPFFASLGAAFGGSRDSGGRGYPGQVYAIGTGAQPEMFIPDTAGTFVPASKQGGQSIVYQTIVQAPEGRITRESEGRLRARDAQRGAMFSGRNG